MMLSRSHSVSFKIKYWHFVRGPVAEGTTGAATAFNADMNNRQLHYTEKDAIRLAANGDKAKEEKLRKAACYEVKCWAQYPEGSTLYKNYFVGQEEMSHLQAEVQWVKEQQKSGAFIYTNFERATDGVAAFTGLSRDSFNGEPIGGLEKSTAKPCVTAECAAGVRPAPSEMRSVDQISKDLNTGICSWAVGGAVNTILPGSAILKPITNAVGKITGWVVEKTFDQTTSATSSIVVCKY